MNKKQLINDLKNELEYLKKELPITMGNLFAKNEELKARINIIDSFNNDNNKWCFDDFQLILLHSKYFVGSLKWECDNDYKELIYNTIKWGFIFGKSCIYKTPNGFISATITKIENDKYNKPFKIEIVPNSFFNNSIYKNLDDVKDEHIIKLTKKDFFNVAFFQWDFMGLPAVWMLKPLITFQNAFFKNFRYQLLNYKNNIIFNNDNFKLDNYDLKTFINDFQNIDKPILLNMDNSLGSSKPFTALELPKNGIDLVEYYNKVKNCFYELIGRRVNLDQKRERNISDEVGINEDIFNSIENETYIYLEKFFNQLNKMGVVCKIWDW